MSNIFNRFANISVCKLSDCEKLECENILKKGNKIALQYNKNRLNFYNALSAGLIDKSKIPSEDLKSLQAVLNIEQKMLEGYLPMACHIVTKFSKNVSDLISESFQDEAMESFREALFTYDGRARFSTYMSVVIKNRLLDVRPVQYRQQHGQFPDIEDFDIKDPAMSINELIDGNWLDMNWEVAYKAIEIAPFNNLQRTVFIEYLENDKRGVFTNAANKCLNPHTGKPYSKVAATNALKSAKKVYRMTYFQLLKNGSLLAA